MNVTFPEGPPVPTTSDTLAFQALVDGEVRPCQISFEALADLAGIEGRGEALIQVFSDHIERIHEVAIVRLHADPDGPWLPQSKHF